MSLNKQSSRAFNRQRDLPNIANEIIFDDSDYNTWGQQWEFDEYWDGDYIDWEYELSFFREREYDEIVMIKMLSLFDKEFF